MRYVIAASLLVLAAIGGLGIASVLRLSSDTRALRRAALTSVAPSRQKCAVRVGNIPTGLVRLIARHFRLPPELRAGLEAFRGGEVSVHEIQQPVSSQARTEMLAALDAAMQPRGWTRTVTVIQNDEAVVIYLPAAAMSPRRAKCSLVVLEDRHLVIASVEGNPRPLLAFAMAHREFRKATKQWRNHCEVASAQ